MASNTRTVTGLGEVFRFTTERKGTVSFFSNDLNISFRVLFQAPGVMLLVHTGPILFLSSSAVGAGTIVTASAASIGSGFPPPPLSLLQLQTDTVAQAPALETLPS